MNAAKSASNSPEINLSKRAKGSDRQTERASSGSLKRRNQNGILTSNGTNDHRARTHRTHMPNLPSRIRTVTQRARKERREIDRTDRKETSARASLERTETTPHSRTRPSSLGTEERESDVGGGERVQRVRRARGTVSNRSGCVARNAPEVALGASADV